MTFILPARTYTDQRRVNAKERPRPDVDTGRRARLHEPMRTLAEVVAAYAAAWNEPDAGVRRRALEKAWTDAGVYSDPTACVEGRDALVAHIAGFHAQMPGARIVLTSGIDEHHGAIRFTWALRAEDGATVTEGVDFGELADDGRLRRITGFFGPPPAS
jgi:SnoaL-like domain